MVNLGVKSYIFRTIIPISKLELVHIIKFRTGINAIATYVYITAFF